MSKSLAQRLWEVYNETWLSEGPRRNPLLWQSLSNQHQMRWQRVAEEVERIVREREPAVR